jgi:hypothetical protein
MPYKENNIWTAGSNLIISYTDEGKNEPGLSFLFTVSHSISQCGIIRLKH